MRKFALLLTLLLMLVGLLTLPIAANARPQDNTRQCKKTFTVFMGRRAARAVYSGTRKVTHKNLRMLAYIERCQRNPLNEPSIRAFYHHERVLWLQRRRRVSMNLSPPAPSQLVQCIIQHESGGNSQAVSPNGVYKGIGQWQDSTWIADGGGRFAPTALGATYNEQLIILEDEGPAQQYQQQGQYDGC